MPVSRASMCQHSYPKRPRSPRGAQELFGTEAGLRKSREETLSREIRQQRSGRYRDERPTQNTARVPPQRDLAIQTPLASVLYPGEDAGTGKPQDPGQMGLLQSHRGVEVAGPTRKRNAFPGASPSLLHEAPAWIPKTRARVTKCREGQPLLSLWPYPHSIPRGSVLFPALPRGAVRRTARPLASLGLGFPLYKEESGEMVSRSLRAPTRQDFLPQWMGSRETETPRLILSGGQMRLEKRAGGHWLGAQPLPNPLAGVTQEGFSGEPKGPPPESPRRPEAYQCLQCQIFTMGLWGRLSPRLECKTFTCGPTLPGLGPGTDGGSGKRAGMERMNE